MWNPAVFLTLATPQKKTAWKTSFQKNQLLNDWYKQSLLLDKVNKHVSRLNTFDWSLSKNAKFYNDIFVYI